ncbi:MAG: YggS family pyridoxal phosphate-dependent enzyme [Thermoguttaceae bacterium]|nr:YggS family pyridoxal phosphate-dependent enzyme [Thermoguttaceae bacterium]
MEQSRWEELRRSTADKLRAVQDRAARAAEKSGRPAEAVRIVAVTKYVEADAGLEAALYAAGCRDFGENRVPHLMEKWNDLDRASKENAPPPQPDPREIRWHFIGSLQRNKVRRLLPYAAMIHSIDTPELFRAVARVMREENDPATRTYAREDALLPFPKTIPVLLEVNISGEGNKHGFQPETFVDQAAPCFETTDRVEIRGLMGMGGLESTPDEVRAQFARLRELRDAAQKAFPGANLTELSMGMSGDFELAIAEGATIVRIGSILY